MKVFPNKEEREKFDNSVTTVTEFKYNARSSVPKLEQFLSIWTFLILRFYFVSILLSILYVAFSLSPSLCSILCCIFFFFSLNNSDKWCFSRSWTLLCLILRFSFLFPPFSLRDCIASNFMWTFVFLFQRFRSPYFFQFFRLLSFSLPIKTFARLLGYEAQTFTSKSKDIGGRWEWKRRIFKK